MTDTITLPDHPLTLEERRENAVKITFEDACANASEAVYLSEQAARLEPMNVKQAKPNLTLRQRWKRWWQHRRMVIIQRELAAEQERLAGLADAARRAKHAAQLAYSCHLQHIDSWRDTEAARAKAEIRELEAELELLEAEQCA